MWPVRRYVRTDTILTTHTLAHRTAFTGRAGLLAESLSVPDHGTAGDMAHTGVARDIGVMATTDEATMDVAMSDAGTRVADMATATLAATVAAVSTAAEQYVAAAASMVAQCAVGAASTAVGTAGDAANEV